MPRHLALSLLCVAAATLGLSATAQDRVSAAAREGQRPDDRRPEQPFSTEVFGRPVQLTGSWEYSDERRLNFDLDANRARDRRVREHEIKLEARTRPTPDTELFLQAVGLHETRRTQGTDGTQRRKSLERGQAWLRLERLGGTPWSLQLGRVALIDRRAWWWDDDLDALRLLYEQGAMKLDTGVAREVLRVSSADRGVLPEARGRTRWFGQASWRLAERHNLDAFWLWQRDGSGAAAPGTVLANEDATDPSDLNARWLGLRASGEFRPEGLPRLAYWVDTAWLRGRETVTDFNEPGDGSFVAGNSATRRVRGNAIDLGATAILPLPLRPSLSLAWARGSGGERSATLDANFRQTGLQENKARLAGVKRLRRYGALLQPELSNLAVTTVGAGLRLLGNSSLELVTHRYRQPVPATSLVDARLSTDPQGRNGDIGRETDLVLALREWRQWELTLAWSVFTPGEAFAPAKRAAAHALEAGLAFNF